MNLHIGLYSIWTFDCNLQIYWVIISSQAPARIQYLIIFHSRNFIWWLIEFGSHHDSLSVSGPGHASLSRTESAREPHQSSPASVSKLWTPLIPHKQYQARPGPMDHVYTRMRPAKVNTSIRYCQDLGRGSESQVWCEESLSDYDQTLCDWDFVDAICCEWPLATTQPPSAASQGIKLDKSREERRYRTEREGRTLYPSIISHGIFSKCTKAAGWCGTHPVSRYKIQENLL